jgi:antibiotic biosynthesis monooxygenase (ABM) superfamily enzyme
VSDPAGGAVTVVVTRVVHPGREREFAAWADEVDRAAAGFTGHLGGVRLHDNQGLHHLVYRFDSERHLVAWERSDRRRELIRRGDRISDEQRATHQAPNAWFSVPGQDTSPRWKTFLLTWLAAYPILLVISTGVRLAAPGLTQPLVLVVSSGTLTALLTWVIMPRLKHLTRPWLLRGARPTPTTARPHRTQD